jgi:hypothetical protein
MTTFLSTQTLDETTRRCDANCHNAKKPSCACICGGMNHGKGNKQAAINTHTHARRIVNDWTKENPDIPKLVVAPWQIRLFSADVH